MFRRLTTWQRPKLTSDLIIRLLVSEIPQVDLRFSLSLALALQLTPPMRRNMRALGLFDQTVKI